MTEESECKKQMESFYDFCIGVCIYCIIYLHFFCVWKIRAYNNRDGKRKLHQMLPAANEFLEKKWVPAKHSLANVCNYRCITTKGCSTEHLLQVCTWISTCSFLFSRYLDVAMFSTKKYIIYWVVPPPSNSDHQDYYIFRLGDPNLNLHLPLLLGGGQSKLYIIQ